MTLNDLSIPPQHFSGENFLSEWTWRIPVDSHPVMVTRMGCIFLQDPAGAVHFLDPVDARCWQITDNAEEFEILLGNQDFVTEYFQLSYFLTMQKNDILLEDNQCYSHKLPLAVSGKDELVNFEPTDISVHVTIHGQIHHQIKDLPEGTPVQVAQPEST